MYVCRGRDTAYVSNERPGMIIGTSGSCNYVTCTAMLVIYPSNKTDVSSCSSLFCVLFHSVRDTAYVPNERPGMIIRRYIGTSGSCNYVTCTAILVIYSSNKTDVSSCSSLFCVLFQSVHSFQSVCMLSLAHCSCLIDCEHVLIVFYFTASHLSQSEGRINSGL